MHWRFAVFFSYSNNGRFHHHLLLLRRGRGGRRGRETLSRVRPKYGWVERERMGIWERDEARKGLVFLSTFSREERTLLTRPFSSTPRSDSFIFHDFSLASFSSSSSSQSLSGVILWLLLRSILDHPFNLSFLSLSYLILADVIVRVVLLLCLCGWSAWSWEGKGGGLGGRNSR